MIIININYNKNNNNNKPLSVLTQNIYDTAFLAQARRKISYVEEAINIIKMLDFASLGLVEQKRIANLVIKLVEGIESAQELSDALSIPIVCQLLPEDSRNRLQSRVEYELTPAEPDPETGDSSSPESLESHLMSEVDPDRIMNLIEKMRRKNQKPRGQWKVRPLPSLNTNSLRNLPPHLGDLVLVILSKVEQLTRIEELDKALELLTFLAKELKKHEHTYQVTIPIFSNFFQLLEVF